MGHAKELITVDVYGDKRPELVSYMADVMPKKKGKQDLKDNVLDAGIELEQYLSKNGMTEEEPLRE